MSTRHATENGQRTLCGIYCGFHRPLPAIKPVQGWEQNVTCKNCKKHSRFKEAA